MTILDQIAILTNNRYNHYELWKHLLPDEIIKIEDENPYFNCLHWVVGFIPTEAVVPNDEPIEIKMANYFALKESLMDAPKISLAEVTIGDIVQYGNDGSHWGKIESINPFMVKSKWAMGPLFLHPFDLVPSHFGHPTNYMSSIYIPKPKSDDKLLIK